MNRTIGLAAGAVLAAVAVPSLAQAENAFTTDLVNLRSGPGYDYPVVFAVPGRQAITSYGCLKDWSWCDVSVGDYRGWMVGDYIAYASSSGWVPVYEYGPRYHVPIVSFNFDTYWDSYYRSRPWYRDRAHWAEYERTHRQIRHDIDHDGIANRYDRDRDGDGIANRYDRDANGNGIADRRERHDIDQDGVANRYDRDGDGVPNWRDRND